MAGVRGVLAAVRARAGNASIKTAFFLYALGAIASALALSALSTYALGLIAQSTLIEDPYAYSGTYVYDASRRALVPAEALSWYEMPAVDAAAEGSARSPSDVVVLYIESQAYSDAKPIYLDAPPASFHDGSIVDISLTADSSAAADERLACDEIAAYDGRMAAARPGADTARRLADILPANADGEQPVVSNVGYYIPYPGDPLPYRMLASLAIASVPVMFVICFLVAGRRFYNARLRQPIAQMDGAARRIAANDLDFHVEAERSDELGRLCEQFEAMRSELERAERALWRAAERQREVQVATAHRLRTPLTVIKGRAQYLVRIAGTERERAAAEAIDRQTDQLALLAAAFASQADRRFIDGLSRRAGSGTADGRHDNPMKH